MGLTPAVEESLTETVTQAVPFSVADAWQSLHSANPGSTGINEITSGTGAGGRQLPSFTGSGGTDANNANVSYTLGADLSATWVGFWTAQTGGTFLGGFPMCAGQKIALAQSGSTHVVCPNHGLSAGQAVRLFTIAGIQSSVPSPFSADFEYIVQQVVDSNTIVLIEAGGIPISATGTGGFAVALDLSQTTGPNGGILTFPASTGIIYSTVS